MKRTTMIRCKRCQNIIAVADEYGLTTKHKQRVVKVSRGMCPIAIAVVCEECTTENKITLCLHETEHR